MCQKGRGGAGERAAGAAPAPQWARHALVCAWWGAQGPFLCRRLALKLCGGGRRRATPPSSGRRQKLQWRTGHKRGARRAAARWPREHRRGRARGARLAPSYRMRCLSLEDFYRAGPKLGRRGAPAWVHLYQSHASPHRRAGCCLVARHCGGGSNRQPPRLPRLRLGLRTRSQRCTRRWGQGMPPAGWAVRKQGAALRRGGRVRHHLAALDLMMTSTICSGGGAAGRQGHLCTSLTPPSHTTPGGPC